MTRSRASEDIFGVQDAARECQERVMGAVKMFVAALDTLVDALDALEGKHIQIQVDIETLSKRLAALERSRGEH